MRSRSKDETHKTARLLIVCLKSDVQRIRSIVDQNAADDWERSGEISLVPVVDRFVIDSKGNKLHERVEGRSRIISEIDRLAPSAEGARILIVGSLRNVALITRDDFRAFTLIDSCEVLSQGLPPILRQAGLDWFSRKMEHLSHYHWDMSGQVNRWLDQFQELRIGWAGSALLRVLDFWPVTRLGNALIRPPAPASSSDWLDPYDYVTYGDPTTGKSSAIISRYLRNRFPQLSTRFSPLNLVKAEQGKRILYFEDCLMTGSECIEVIKASKHLSQAGCAIDLKFGTGTQYGIERVKNFLRRNELSAVNLISSPDAFISNLNSEAIDRANRGRLFSDTDNLIGGGIIPGLKLAGTRTLTSDQRKNLLYICRQLGKQLMFSYFQGFQHEPAQAAELAAEHSLGFGNMALVTAFAHGVPDNILPVIRCAGTVSFEDRRCDWKPLFPHTKYLTGVQL